MLIYKNETKLTLEFPSPDHCARFEQWLRATMVLFDADLSAPSPSSPTDQQEPKPLHRPVRKEEWQLARIEKSRNKQHADAVAKKTLPLQFRSGAYPWTKNHDPNAR